MKIVITNDSKLENHEALLYIMRNINLKDKKEAFKSQVIEDQHRGLVVKRRVSKTVLSITLLDYME